VGEGEREEEREGDMLRGLSPQTKNADYVPGQNATTSLFFVAADTHNQSFCEFFGVRSVNSFFITEHNEDNVIQELFFEQLSLAWQYISVSSSAGFSFNTSKQDRCGKMIRMTADCAISYLVC